MARTLQIIQIGLFSLPIISLLGLGVSILAKPIVVIDRRWYLAVIIPLLLANPLILMENVAISESVPTPGWRFWLVLVVDVLLLVGSIWKLRGFLIYGMTATDVEATLIHAFTEKGMQVSRNMGVKNSLLGWGGTAQVLTVDGEEGSIDIWVTDRFKEVLLQADSKDGYMLIKSGLSAIRQKDQPYQINAHIMGLLYLIFALVLTVMMWIFFFEPKLIQID